MGTKKPTGEFIVKRGHSSFLMMIFNEAAFIVGAVLIWIFFVATGTENASGGNAEIFAGTPDFAAAGTRNADDWPMIAIFAIGALAFVMISKFWTYLSFSWTLTSERIIIAHGVIVKDERSIFLSDIRAIDVKRSTLDWFLGTGTVSIASSATSEMEMTLPHIESPNDFRAAAEHYRRTSGR